jgi:predicted transglutaminase-like cysteine proteinase
MSVRMQNWSLANHDLRWALVISPMLAAVILAVVQLQLLPAATLSADFGRIEAVSFVADGANPDARESVASVRIIEHASPLFGMDTEPVIEGEIPRKWERAMAGIARELQIVERCRVNNVCPAAARRLIDLSSEGAGRSDRIKVGLINRAVDLAIRPVSDEAQWRLPDHWNTPFETLQSGQGDCEDYAIVKYVALLQAGISGNDLKIVIVKNVFPKVDHAVAAVRVDGEWLILDNRTFMLVRDTDLARAVPKLVLDHEGVRRFVPKGRSLRVG